MKNYIKKLSLKGKDKGKNIDFGGLFLNSDGILEFRYSNVFTHPGLSYLYSEDKKAIEIQGLDKSIFIKLPEKEANKLMEFKKEVINKLGNLYKSIVSGKEKLICFPIGLDDFPYLITTDTILNEAEYSSKYTEALRYAFSDKCLRDFDIGRYPGFEGYEDMQKRLGEAVVKLGLKPTNYNGEEAVITTLLEIIEGVF